MDASSDRLTIMEKQLASLGIEVTRISAVNGNELSCEAIRKLIYPINHFESKVKFTRELTRGEIGCFLSHRRCWQRLVDSGEDFALIMEDDILLSHASSKFFNSISWLPAGIDVCQFSCLKQETTGRINPHRHKLADNFELVQPTYPPPLGTQCYLISSLAAKIALVTSTKLIAPVDNFLFSPWFDFCKIFPTWKISPTLCLENKTLISEIGDRTKRSVQKAPFLIRHGITRLVLERLVKRFEKSGIPHTFAFLP